jgi:hypothetical protein
VRPSDDALKGEGKSVPDIRIIRRLGSTPQERGSAQEMSCPDIFELASGDFAVIGTDATEDADLLASLPADAGVAPYEKVVVVSRATFVHAKRDIPDS